MLSFLVTFVEYILFGISFILLFLKSGKSIQAKSEPVQEKIPTPSQEIPKISPKIEINSKPQNVEKKEEVKKIDTPEVRTPETPVQNKKIEIVMNENATENYLDQKIGQKERTILTSESSKRSSLSLKNRKRASMNQRGSILEQLLSTNSLDAPTSSEFEDLEEKTMRESFEKRMEEDRKKNEKDYVPKEEVPVKKGPPPMPVLNSNSNGSSSKVNSNQLLEMKSLLKKTQK